MVIIKENLTDYNHNHQAETAIRRDIFERIGFVTEGFPQEYRPEFDYKIGLKTPPFDLLPLFEVEQKITEFNSGNYSYFLMELARDSEQKIPSAFALCTAPLTLIIMPGYSRVKGTMAGYKLATKFRMYRTKDLMEAATNEEFHGGPNTKGDYRRPAPNIDYGYAVEVYGKLIPHLWLGQCPFVPGRINTAHFMPNPRALEQFLQMFSPQEMELPSEEYYDKYR